MSRGDVLGVFQVEGAGMRRMLMEMKPSKFEHIVAGISLFRPGPMDYIPTYIKRLHGEEPVEYQAPETGADPRRDLRHHRLSGTDHPDRGAAGGLSAR